MPRFFTLLLAGGAVFALSACATSTDPTSVELAEALPDHGEISDGDTFTCRRIQITGTRMFERVCARDSQWAEQADRTGEAVNAIGTADRSQTRPYDPPGF